MKYLPIYFAMSFFLLVSCSKEETSVASNDPIIGTWRLTNVNEYDVSNIDCYNESYLRIDTDEIFMYLVELNEDETCSILLDDAVPYENQEGFYYMGEEAVEIYVDENELTWRVDLSSTLIFRRAQ